MPLRRLFTTLASGLVFSAACTSTTLAADEPQRGSGMKLSILDLLEAGGTIGWIIMLLSVILVALIIEHAITIRRKTLIPEGLPDEAQRLIGQGHFKPAIQLCQLQPSFLASLLSAGLAEVALGYAAVEKAMEDAAQQQAARLFRKLEYFTVIGTIAPMLGLLGTVWGMILAFMEFETKANPQVSELAPGIYRALVTTLQGLCVAIPALSAYAVLRNRVDELVAEATLAAEHAFTTFRRATQKKRSDPTKAPRREAEPQDVATSPPANYPHLQTPDVAPDSRSKPEIDDEP